MSVLRFEGRLVEIMVVSSAEDDDGWVAEVWDLTPGTGGLVMQVHEDAGGTLLVDLLGARQEARLVTWAVEAARAELGAQ
ncbi:hypothetical protein ACFQV2_34650 [Actinokineospora soli]|uniref:Uncharacterized protein n=1 Tax=Actinokineospora soli TaxID=1048753 RepID=A0ABW2TVL9_9PSEU